MKSMFLTIAILLTVACCGGATIVAALNTDTSSDKVEDTATVQETSAASQPAKKADGISGDGTWMIPSDVKPGKYKTTVPSKSFGCYWARLRGTSGELSDIIANGSANAGSQVLITIDATDKAFQSTRCGSWTRISD